MTEFKTPSEGKRYRRKGVLHDYAGLNITRKELRHVFQYWDVTGRRKERLYKKGSSHLSKFEAVDA